MSSQPTAISEIDDADEIRVQLLASGRGVHAPLQNLVDIAVPIYGTVTDMPDKRVPASVTALRVNGYYTAGDGGEALYKKVAVEPSHAGKFQSKDGAWWEISEAVVTPQMVGVISDGGVSTQTTAMQAWLDTCDALDKPQIALSPLHVRIADTLTFPTARDIDIQCLAITYAGTHNRKVLYVPGGSVRLMKFGIVQSDTVDWTTSDDYVGIYLEDLQSCEVHLNLTRRFTVGYAMIGNGATGCAYNRIYPGQIRDCKYNERLKSLTAGGFVNQNVFIHGNYGNTSAASALGVAYGTHITAAPGGYDGHNNNLWDSPNYEMGGAAGVNRVPFFFDGAGGSNLCEGATRAEACFGPLVICSGENVRRNEIGFNFASTAIAGQLNAIQEVNGANGNRLTGKTGGESRRPWDNLHRLLSSDGTAVGGYVRGDVFLIESDASVAKRAATFAGRISSNALGLDLAASCGVMVAVDTSKIKLWRLTPAYAGSSVGAVLAIAFDSTGTRLTGNATSIYGTTWAPTTAYAVGDIVQNDTGKIYRCSVAGTSAGAGGPTGTGSSIVDGTCTWNYFGTDKYIKNESGGWTDTVSFGGGYTAATFTGGLFSVRPEVQTMWIGIIGAATVSSFEITGYWTTETLDNTVGLQSVSTWVPLDDGGSVPLASANPGTLGRHGYYSKGHVVWDSAVAAGVAAGWQCTTAGWLAAPWTISTAYTRIGRIVTNDTGKVYQLVTAGTSAGAGGPTGTGAAITDGTCVWNYVGVLAVFTAIPALVYSTSAASPVGVTTPSAIGLWHFDTAAAHFYMSTGLTNADWKLVTI
ncbi:hypothetical protein [Mesorhizobium sp.]|uniref:hypothetical protein n=1 Tax=Mesorhizobium sp. TaxID=1871066 RepID=UPI000FE9D922|nr:hypothetical protein [Mesorhizobium sp.]RWO22807.1 MAG: hypothetical protein EOS09_19245 [Mesorhizobium sp.]